VGEKPKAVTNNSLPNQPWESEVMSINSIQLCGRIHDHAAGVQLQSPLDMYTGERKGQQSGDEKNAM